MDSEMDFKKIKCNLYLKYLKENNLKEEFSRYYCSFSFWLV